MEGYTVARKVKRVLSQAEKEEAAQIETDAQAVEKVLVEELRGTLKLYPQLAESDEEGQNFTHRAKGAGLLQYRKILSFKPGP